MTEKDYIVATNLAKVRAAIDLVKDITPGNHLGIHPESWRAVSGALQEWMEKSGALIEIDHHAQAGGNL